MVMAAPMAAAVVASAAVAATAVKAAPFVSTGNFAMGWPGWKQNEYIPSLFDGIAAGYGHTHRAMRMRDFRHRYGGDAEIDAPDPTSRGRSLHTSARPERPWLDRFSFAAPVYGAESLSDRTSKSGEQ